MIFVKVIDLISEKISGEWGEEPENGDGVNILRTTNFTNEGRLNLNSIAKRAVDDEIVLKKRLMVGDTLIEKSGGSPSQPVGRVVFFDIEDGKTYLCNNFTAILRPRNGVFPKYFFYALFYKHLNKATLRYQNKTTGIINLQLERYLQEVVPLPPLPIQKQIAAILEKADSAREKRRQANRLTEQFLQSAFLEMFGDPVTNPKGWDVFILGDILEKIESGHSPVCLERTADEGEWGVLKLSSVTPGHYDWGENKALPGNVSPSEGNEVKQGDLLFVRKNTYELVGRTALVLETKPRLLLSDLIFRLVIKDPSSVEPSYLWFSLNHPGIHKRVQSQAGGAAGSMPNISKERLKKVSIPIPPVSLQHQFTDLLEKVESLRARQRESEKELEGLFGSLMQRAFRGELV